MKLYAVVFLTVPISIKKIKGKYYLYFAYYDASEQKKKEIYCGLKGNAKSEAKALELELEYLRANRKDLDERIGDAELKLKHIDYGEPS